MLRFISMRVLAAIPILVLLSIVTFVIIKAQPGDYGDYIRSMLMNQGHASYADAEEQAQA
jgi:peptide/nickel transport system permease protein